MSGGRGGREEPEEKKLSKKSVGEAPLKWRSPQFPSTSLHSVLFNLEILTPSSKGLEHEATVAGATAGTSSFVLRSPSSLDMILLSNYEPGLNWEPL